MEAHHWVVRPTDRVSNERKTASATNVRVFPLFQTCIMCCCRDGKKTFNMRSVGGLLHGVLDGDFNAAVTLMLCAFEIAEQAESLNACGGSAKLRIAGTVCPRSMSPDRLPEDRSSRHPCPLRRVGRQQCSVSMNNRTKGDGIDKSDRNPTKGCRIRHGYNRGECSTCCSSN